MDDPRRHVPRTDAVLADSRLSPVIERLGRSLVKEAVTGVLAGCRAGALAPDAVVPTVLAELPGSATSLRPVINATGVIVHTNLGRAPMSAAAVDALQIAAGSTDVELDLETGVRGRRGAGALAALAAAVPDADDVLVVNNGAAALSLAVHALTTADTREIIVARGELVEIGDGFRIPDVLTASGGVLREVGTTNRVGFDDYAAAVCHSTAFVLKVHPSNFVVKGFTSGVAVSGLSRLPVPVIADIGSGLLAPHRRLPGEPDATTTLRAGAALVTASGDKLLGGPQAGLVLGRAALVQRLRRHPLARAFRVDKLTLAALEATMRGPLPPVRIALEAEPADLRRRAQEICSHLADVPAEAVDSTAVVGGGGAPGVELASAAIAVPARLAGPLRAGHPAVVGRIAHDRLLLDLIAVEPASDAALLDAVRRAARE
jgi:L-seryl-tRNA(Ser) seleniumtransferase